MSSSYAFLICMDCAPCMPLRPHHSIVKEAEKVNLTEPSHPAMGLGQPEAYTNGDVPYYFNICPMDGLEFVKRVRDSEWKAIPILMVTTNAAKEDIVEALQAGVNNYVVKPFTPETLKEKIELLINS